MTHWLKHLQDTHPAQAVLTTEADCAAYLTEWRGLWTGRTAAVLRPGSTEEAQMMMRITAEAGIDIVPQGGHTGLCGGAMPDMTGEQIIICTDRLKTVRELDPLNNTITVEAGVTLQSVQNMATEANRLFPLSLASEGTCQIGGNIATNAGGIHVLRYGTMRDLVMGLEVVQPDGSLWTNLSGLRKDNTGYDLKQLFIGSEGTLGLITAATLKLFPKPLDHTSIFCAVDSPTSALEALNSLSEAFGTRLIAAELLPRIGLDFVLKHSATARDPFVAQHPWYVLFDLEHHGQVDDPTDSISNAFESVPGLEDAIISTSAQQRADLWHIRESLSEAQKPEGGSIKHDIAVPVSRVPQFLDQATKAIEAWMPGIRVIAFGHIGDGNIHYNLSQPVDMDKQVFLDRWAEANEIVHDIVSDMGGSISAEHGIGSLKREELATRSQKSKITMMVGIKAALDPTGRMNPGKIL